MQYPVYDEYKNTQNQWIKNIPCDWDIMNLSHAVRMKSGENITSLEISPVGNYPVYGGNGVRGFFDANTHSGEFILIGRQGALCGNIYLVKGDFWASEHAVVVTPDRELNIAWLSYLLTSMDLNQYSVSAAQPGLSVEAIGRLKIPFPPLVEQKNIAKFLDHKTKQIDQLIEKKKALIEKLNEQRIAVITRAVTKGLDETVPMKDSGVEWLGQVPEHWEIKKIKYITNILRGKFSHRPRNDPAYYDGDYPFIQTGDVANAQKYVKEYSQTLNEKGYAVSKEFPMGTLVMTIAANIGDMAIMDFNACFPDSIVGFVPEKSVDLDFLYYLFVAMKSELMKTAVLNTQLNLNIERIASLTAVCPNFDDQKNIAKYLEGEIVKMDKLQDQIRKAIQTLAEYRTALITNAVTGKIDVRNIELN